jgi:NAD(P)-dependent dehydrogenase (short-subunit alcohol dehydrogenase family)
VLGEGDEPFDVTDVGHQPERDTHRTAAGQAEQVDVVVYRQVAVRPEPRQSPPPEPDGDRVHPDSVHNGQSGGFRQHRQHRRHGGKSRTSRPPAYGATKADLASLTQGRTAEYRPRGVRVNIVALP